jgi:brefeldin A-resistance guanine nucleotide exchange factor 1
MLLVLSSGGYLSPPDEKPEQEQIWNETWKRINRFQPNLLAELFPDEAGRPPKTRGEERAPVESAPVESAKGEEEEEKEEKEGKAEGVEQELVVGEGKKEKVDEKES